MLRIHDVTLELIRELVPVVKAIKRHDPEHAKQLRDAVNSTRLNIAEGSEQQGGRRNSHYRIALGSANEARSALEAAVAWEYIGPPSEAVNAKLRQIIGTLVNVTKA